MAEVTASMVKELRERTGAGMMDCKRALGETGGDLDKAIELLRVKGQAQAAKRGERAAGEGTVQSYIHSNAKVGVLVEVNCETDFVARNEDFVAFAREVAMHVAASPATLVVSEDEVDEDAKAAELKIFSEQAAGDGKPAEIQAKIAEGRIGKWLDEVVLLRQPHVNQDKYDGKTIEDLRAEASAVMKENVVIRRFARFAVGE